MIGNMPRYAPKKARRTLTYTPRWMHAGRGATPNSMLDPPTELPVATLQSRTWSGTSARLRGHLAQRWQWLRPRTVPMLVAFASLVAMLASTSYLSNLARKTPAQRAPMRVVSTQPPAELTTVESSITESATESAITITIDGNPAPVGRVLEVPRSIYRVELIPTDLPDP